MKVLLYINWWIHMIAWNYMYFKYEDNNYDLIIMMWISLIGYEILKRLDKQLKED